MHGLCMAVQLINIIGNHCFFCRTKFSVRDFRLPPDVDEVSACLGCYSA